MTSKFPPIPNAGTEGDIGGTIFNNPFILPGDDQIFRMREEGQSLLLFLSLLLSLLLSLSSLL